MTQLIMPGKVLSIIDRIGADPSDNDEVRLKKTLLVSTSLMVSVAGLIWGLLYIFLNEPLAGTIPISYSAISLLSLVHFVLTSRYKFFRFSQLVLILVLPFLLALVLGGFSDSGAVILWALVCPLGALVFDEPHRVWRWFFAYLSLVILNAFLQPYIRIANNLSSTVITLFFLMNISAVSSVAFILVRHFAYQVRERSAQLSQALNDLKATQNQLVETEKMAALGGLVAGVAHEINTPVGIGVTAASLLEDKTTDFRAIYQGGQMKRSDLEKYLDTAGQSSSMILKNLSRAAELIQSFKQVAVDQSSEERREFPVKTYLEEILLSLRPQLKKTQHTIEINGDASLTLDSYPGVFSQVVTNLVLNSLLHAYEPDDKGQLTFDFYQQDGIFSFAYADDGRGIPKENLSKIFDPFFTTKRGQGGSGLGLHIIYNLVTQRLGGTIRCESEFMNGTRFIIEMPISNLASGS